jgi:hypothetical protein
MTCRAARAGTAVYGAINWQDAFGDVVEELKAQHSRRDRKSSDFWWR